MKPLAIGILAVMIAGAAAAQDADEALYLQRFGKTGQNAQNSYDTLEAVPGAPGAKPLPLNPSGAIAPAALKAAEDYAAANNSTAFLVWKDGRLEAARYFGVTPDQALLSRSLAKPLSSIAVGRAMALGKIRSLDQSAADYFPEWRGTPKAAVTIRQILHMTSGFLPQQFSDDPTNIWSRAYLHPRHDRIMLEEYPLSDPPGAKYGYSNAVGDMVALIIERATGRRYGEFVSTEILQPIGAQGGQIWVGKPGALAHSGCCILLPADSFLRLGVLLAQDGTWEGKRLLADGYVAEMRKGSDANPWYGLGVYVAPRHIERRGFFTAPDDKEGVLHSEPFADPDIFMFDGNSNQVVYILPSRRLVILRMGTLPPKTPEWDNAVLPNVIVRGMAEKR